MDLSVATATAIPDLPPTPLNFSAAAAAKAAEAA